jgi:hypothetical protein
LRVLDWDGVKNYLPWNISDVDDIEKRRDEKRREERTKKRIK